jgi:hypothetical protein
MSIYLNKVLNFSWSAANPSPKVASKTKEGCSCEDKPWYEDLADLILGGGSAACNSTPDLPTPGPDASVDVNLGDVIHSDAVEFEMGDGGVMIWEHYIDDLGERIQDSGEISVGPVPFSFSGASGRTVRIVIESVPANLNAGLDGVNGAIDVTPIEERPDAFNIGTEEAPIWIKDPFNQDNRIQVFMGDFTFADLRGIMANINEEACTADEIASADITEEICLPENLPEADEVTQELCENRIVAAGPDSYSVTVPSSLYDNDEGNFMLDFKLRFDASNYNPGHKYDLRLIIRLVIE